MGAADPEGRGMASPRGYDGLVWLHRGGFTWLHLKIG